MVSKKDRRKFLKPGTFARTADGHTYAYDGAQGGYINFKNQLQAVISPLSPLKLKVYETDGRKPEKREYSAVKLLDVPLNMMDERSRARSLQHRHVIAACINGVLKMESVAEKVVNKFRKDRWVDTSQYERDDGQQAQQFKVDMLSDPEGMLSAIKRACYGNPKKAYANELEKLRSLEQRREGGKFQSIVEFTAVVRAQAETVQDLHETHAFPHDDVLRVFEHGITNPKALSAYLSHLANADDNDRDDIEWHYEKLENIGLYITRDSEQPTLSSNSPGLNAMIPKSSSSRERNNDRKSTYVPGEFTRRCHNCNTVCGYMARDCPKQHTKQTLAAAKRREQRTTTGQKRKHGDRSTHSEQRMSFKALATQLNQSLATLAKTVASHSTSQDKQDTKDVPVTQFKLNFVLADLANFSMAAVTMGISGNMIDSGAGVGGAHRDMLHNFTDAREVVHGANGHFTVLGYGDYTVDVPVIDDDGKPRVLNITFPKVRALNHLPEQCAILSVSQLQRNGIGYYAPPADTPGDTGPAFLFVPGKWQCALVAYSGTHWIPTPTRN